MTQEDRLACLEISGIGVVPQGGALRMIPGLTPEGKVVQEPMDSPPRQAS